MITGFSKKRILAVIAIAGVTMSAGASTTFAGEKKCCQQKKNHEIRVPGYSIQGPNLTISTTNTKIVGGGKAVVEGGGQGFVLQNPQASRFFYGGGGGGVFTEGGVSTVITNLNVEADAHAEIITEQVEVPYTETVTRTRWVEKTYVLQAVCMDDSSTPHPAARPDPDERVDPEFSGELFRCMAGTWMQVTLGHYNKGDSNGPFDNGRTIVCAKGEALVHRPGGQVSCAPQIPKRSCNERSLLRKYGAGVKTVHIARQEQYTEQITKTRLETRTREVHSSASASGSASSKVKRTLVLSGGVGGG